MMMMNLLEPPGPVQTCTGIALPFFLPLHISSRLTAHHQEVQHCMYSSWFMSCVNVDWLLAGSIGSSMPILLAAGQHKHMTYTNPPDDEQ